MKFTKCNCSRCRLYLKADADFDYDQYEMKVQYFEHREYQHYLLEIAKKNNIIACLPTGSGKTFIAYKLIEHFNEDLLNNSKKVFFLANTIPLTNQQAAFFARHTILNVRHITGDMEVDYWSEEKWKNIIEGFHIMAMTAQIFLNLIRHGYIQFRQVALLVFDECHHAVKEHPMNQIMREYHRTKNADKNYPLPRILGLTATIIKGNCKPAEVEKLVKELENTMDATAVTYKDYEEVMKNSTNAKVTPSLVNNAKQYDWYPEELLQELEDLSKRLQIFRNERKKQKLALAKVPIDGIHTTLRNSNNLYLTFKSPSPGDLKTALDDVRHTYEELGPYCAVIAISLRLAFIDFSLMDLNSGTIKKWYHDVKTFLQKMKCSSKQLPKLITVAKYLDCGNHDEFDKVVLVTLMESRSESERILYFISPKLKQLLNVISEFRDAELPAEERDTAEDDKSLCGLVFVDRRATAQVLAWYLKDLAGIGQESTNIYSFIRANFVVGTSRCPFETVESRIYAKKQTETINKFRNKTFNVLTATSVLEEGIDVPSCNLVIRFDPIPTYTSYIQSMGRARKRDAKFIIFLKPENYSKEMLKIENFKRIHEFLVSYLQKQVTKVDSDPISRGAVFVDEIEPLCPGGTPDSPRITMDSALEVIDRYCMILPCDGVSTLHTISWFQEQEIAKFQAFLKLPLNSAVKGVISGLHMSNKELARQAVFLEGAKRLHEAGILDEKLIPVHPQFPAKVEAFFNILAPTAKPDEGEPEKEEGEIDEEEPEKSVKRPEWYSKKLCKILFGADNFIKSTGQYHVVRLCIQTINQEEVEPKDVLYKWDESKINFSFGLLTSEEVPDIGDFPLYGAFGNLNVSLERIKNVVSMSYSFLDQIQRFQDTVFSDILGIRHSLFRRNREQKCYVVPLFKVGNHWKISFEANDLDLQSLAASKNMRPPKRNKFRDRHYPTPPKMRKQATEYDRKYIGSIVMPWYKRKSKPKIRKRKTKRSSKKRLYAKLENKILDTFFLLKFFHKAIRLGGDPTSKIGNSNLYFVDSVAHDMSPMSKFHAGEFPTYKNFLQKEYKVEIEDISQPMLKCKLAGIGEGQKQLNYLLKKYSKEDEFPVYLVPELCYIIPLPASFVVQLKLLPSILHRLGRLLLAKEILEDIGRSCAWKGALGNDHRDVDKEIVTLTRTHEIQRKEEEERRKNRLLMRARIKMVNKPIQDPQNLENRELHYEFIHPNKITQKDIKLFHEAVSIQHAAKKLTIKNDIDYDEISVLSPASKLEMINPDDVMLPKLEIPIDLEENRGPSLIAIMEAITLWNSNEGLSNNDYKVIGASFLNYAVSAYCYFNFPDWNEPLMCQLRNKLLRTQTICATAKKRNIAGILSGSYFHPNDTWLPPGFKLQNGVAEIAADAKVHLGVYDKILKTISTMNGEELERYVLKEAPGIWEAKNPPAKGKHVVKHTTYTHSEMPDWNIANGVSALVGTFFTQCGAIGAYKLLEWLEFKCPDLHGNDLNLNDNVATNTPNSSTTPVNVVNIEKMLPGLKKFEELINYTFKDKKLILEAFTHPSYPANNISECYQRLEFLGDSVLDLLITNYVHTSAERKISADNLRDICLALINNITYASLAVRYGFHKHLLSMSQALVDMIDNFVVYQEAVEHQVVGHFTLVSDEECWGPKHMEVPKILGDIFEAVAGAIYIDSNYSLDTVWAVYFRLMQNEIDTFLEDIPKSPLHELKAKFGDKLQLQIWTSKKVKARGRDMCRISIGEYGHYFGCGTNMARSKFAAAKIALKMMKEEDAFTKDLDAKSIMLLM